MTASQQCKYQRQKLLGFVLATILKKMERRYLPFRWLVSWKIKTLDDRGNPISGGDLSKISSSTVHFARLSMIRVWHSTLALMSVYTTSDPFLGSPFSCAWYYLGFFYSNYFLIRQWPRQYCTQNIYLSMFVHRIGIFLAAERSTLR